ncbi:DUF6252 family protein [Pedobacter puniceum]|uniref:Lipoprotein n=1 Tax=Pedobacter puniceum TaxID=2666136 RepID=A0A7K0FR54_9SPHI|nr:DUF6252 family protein [Pedobacter puniceum]MRX48488.1 hypothetical protein [Pedobacter puniceum]
MKTLKYIIILISYLSLSASSCKKDKTGIDALPAATQEGKNTFGCLVNGEVFIARSRTGFGPPYFACEYGFNSETNSFRFYLRGSDRIQSSNRNTIIISFNGISLISGTRLDIRELQDGYANAIYFKTSIDEFNTNATSKGEITITKLDESKRIISGTFWFDAVNETGEKVEVREGRFDMSYR